MQKRGQWLLVLTGASTLLVAACALLAISARPLRIAWHRSEMEEAFVRLKTEKTYEKGSILLNPRHLERFEWHRDELVKLRALIRREYQLRNVYAPTARSKELIGFLFQDNGPPRVYFTSVHPRTEERLSLTVWCWPDKVLELDAFKAADEPANSSPPLE